VAGADEFEVAAVEGEDAADVQAFSHGDDGGVYEVEFGVVVLVEEFGRSFQVAIEQWD
jgi:hypothetical protein